MPQPTVITVQQGLSPTACSYRFYKVDGKYKRVCCHSFHVRCFWYLLMSWSFRLTTALKCCTIISTNSCKHFVTEGGVDSTCPLSRCVSSTSSNFHFMQDLLFLSVLAHLTTKESSKETLEMTLAWSESEAYCVESENERWNVRFPVRLLFILQHFHHNALEEAKQHFLSIKYPVIQDTMLLSTCFTLCFTQRSWMALKTVQSKIVLAVLQPPL